MYVCRCGKHKAIATKVYVRRPCLKWLLGLFLKVGLLYSGRFCPLSRCLLFSAGQLVGFSTGFLSEVRGSNGYSSGHTKPSSNEPSSEPLIGVASYVVQLPFICCSFKSSSSPSCVRGTLPADGQCVSSSFGAQDNKRKQWSGRATSNQLSFEMTSPRNRSGNPPWKAEPKGQRLRMR